MTAFFDFFRNTVLTMSAVAGLSVTAASAAPVTIASDFQALEPSGFGVVVGEFAAPIVPGAGGPHTPSSALGDPGTLMSDSGAAFRSFGDRNSTPPIEQLRFNPDLTGLNLAQAQGNSSNYAGAIGAPLPTSSGDRPNPTVVTIPLPTGGLLALAGLGLIGARRSRSAT